MWRLVDKFVGASQLHVIHENTQDAHTCAEKAAKLECRVEKRIEFTQRTTTNRILHPVG